MIVGRLVRRVEVGSIERKKRVLKMIMRIGLDRFDDRRVRQVINLVDTMDQRILLSGIRSDRLDEAEGRQDDLRRRSSEEGDYGFDGRDDLEMGRVGRASSPSLRSEERLRGGRVRGYKHNRLVV